MHDNIERTYILYVPDSYSSQNPAPVVFNFHGYTSNATEQMFYGDFRPIADTAGFLVVHPMGTQDNFGNPHFNVGWGGSTVDDVGFTEALIDSLAADYSINLDKIYSTGMSNGGFMSYQLACQLSDKIAAVASVTGSFSPSVLGNCVPNRPVPIMEIHGTNDNVVEYNGSFIAVAIPDVIAYWTEENNCEEQPTVTPVPDIDMNDGSTVDHIVHANGDQGVQVELFRVNGGGHTWPGNFIGGAGTNYDIDASKEVWNFFARYDINGSIQMSSVDDVNDENTFLIFPNPVDGSTITLETDDFENYYEIYTLHGQFLSAGDIFSTNQTIDVSDMSSGFYLIRVGDQIQKLVLK